MAKAKSWEEYKVECEAVAKEGITILGFVPPWNGDKTKLFCNCEKHGKWSTTSINGFKNGRSCSGCKAESIGHHNRSNSSKIILKLQMQCERQEYRYIGIPGEYKNGNCKIEYECRNHGIQSMRITDFLHGRGCPGCGRENTIKAHIKSEDTHIQEFMKTGKFLKGTIFTRSECKDLGSYWNYICPKCSNDKYVQDGVCSGVFEAAVNSLKAGKLSCRCSKKYLYTREQWEYRIRKECKQKKYVFIGWAGIKWGVNSKFKYFCHSHGTQTTTPSKLLSGRGCPLCAGHTQQECYINSIWDEDIVRGIKFGISVNSDSRLKRQNRRNLFQMKQMKVYLFPDVSSCKKAERACLKRLQCGIVSSRELKDGYSETTSLINLETVEDIFKEFGGVLKP